MIYEGYVPAFEGRKAWSLLKLRKRDGDYYGCTSGRSRVDTGEQALGIQ